MDEQKSTRANTELGLRIQRDEWRIQWCRWRTWRWWWWTFMAWPSRCQQLWRWPPFLWIPPPDPLWRLGFGTISSLAAVLFVFWQIEAIGLNTWRGGRAGVCDSHRYGQVRPYRWLLSLPSSPGHEFSPSVSFQRIFFSTAKAFSAPNQHIYSHTWTNCLVWNFSNS